MKKRKKINKIKRARNKQRFTKSWLDKIKLREPNLMDSSGDGPGIVAQIGDQYFSSLNTNSTFDADDMMVVPTGIGEINLNFNLSFEGDCDWSIERKPGDYFTSAAPYLDADEDDSAYAYLGSDAEGAFHIRVVTGDTPELEYYLNIVFVQAVLVNNTNVITKNNTFEKYSASFGMFGIQTTDNSITFSDDDNDFRVQLLGGGSDAKLGVNYITCGWLQNITDMEPYANYSDGGQEYWEPTVDLPCLDADPNIAINGGDSAFLTFSFFEENGTGAIGRTYKV